MFVFFFKQKTAYEMCISDWSSDVCSSDLLTHCLGGLEIALIGRAGKQLRPMCRLLGSNPVHRLPGTEQLARFWRGCDLGVEILQRAFAMALDRFLDCGIDRVIVG